MISGLCLTIDEVEELYDILGECLDNVPDGELQNKICTFRERIDIACPVSEEAEVEEG